MKRIAKITPVILLSLVFFIMIGLLVSMWEFDKQNVENTIGLKATVSEIRIENLVQDTYIEIFTNEYRQ